MKNAENRKKTKNKSLTVFLAVLLLAAFLVSVFFVCMNVWQKAEKRMYPLDYYDIVAKYSKEFGVPESVILAVMRTESGFDPDAESAAGAKGLMQLMPTTYEWLLGKLKEDEGDITDPETNIKYGTYLLSILYNRFEDRDCAIAAYNAGIGRVGKWVDNPEYFKNGKLEVIPIEETDTYVKRVNKAIEAYKRIYGIDA